MRTNFALLMLLMSCLPLAENVCALTDPTRPSGFVAPASGERQEETLRLESVLIAADRRVAVINGKTCSVGEHVGGATVMAINADTVLLVRDGKRITLPLRKLKVRSGEH